jgi:hypothetical protein
MTLKRLFSVCVVGTVILASCLYGQTTNATLVRRGDAIDRRHGRNYCGQEPRDRPTRQVQTNDSACIGLPLNPVRTKWTASAPIQGKVSSNIVLEMASNESRFPTGIGQITGP